MEINIQIRNKNQKLTDAVPVIIYGKVDSNNINILGSLDKKTAEYISGWGSKGIIRTINVNNNQFYSIIKDIQIHPVTRDIMHIDFLVCNLGDYVSTYIKVSVCGKDQCNGVKQGGILYIPQKEVPVSLHVTKDAISEIKLDISHLQKSEKILSKNVNINGIKFLTDIPLVIIKKR